VAVAFDGERYLVVYGHSTLQEIRWTKALRTDGAAYAKYSLQADPRSWAEMRRFFDEIFA
jgi:hypothetical protein